MNLPLIFLSYVSLYLALIYGKAYLIFEVCSPSNDAVSIYAIPSASLELISKRSAGNKLPSLILQRSPTTTSFHLMICIMPFRRTLVTFSFTSLSVE